MDAVIHNDVNAIFRGKSVLVTGHTGFKGAWLCLWLHQLGARITGLAHDALVPSLFNSAAVDKLLAEHRIGDVRDREHVADAVAASMPDMIFHLAAQPLVGRGYREPRLTFETNVMGTVNILDVLRDYERRCAVVMVSSDKCYSVSDDSAGLTEADALGGPDPYSASKSAMEHVVAAYRNAYFAKANRHIAVATVRAGNVIGGGDWAEDRLIPDMVTELSVGHPIRLRRPAAVRPWQHVLEPLSGYMHVASALYRDENRCWQSGWNFGPLPAGHRSVADVVDLFCRAWGDGRWVADTDAQYDETDELRLNIEKAAMQLGWQPRWSLDEAVARTASWYRECVGQEVEAVRTGCLHDIHHYGSPIAS